MNSDYREISSILFRMKERNIFQKYIDFIHFPFYRNMEVNTRINFVYPLTVIVGQNGCGKSSLLHAIYGLNSSSKCNGIHINNLFKFFVWCEVSKSFTRSII